MNQNTLILIIGAFLAILTLLNRIIKIVPEAEEWMLERFGRFSETLQPGIHFILPFIEKIGEKISMREQVLDISPQAVITKDNAILTVDGVVFYRVFNSKKAAYMVDHLEFAISQLIMTNIRTVLGEMELDSTLSNRETINRKLLSVVDLATDPWGIKVIRIEIKDIQPPADLQEAMSRQMKAEREKRALILEAEGERDAAILKANGQKVSAILEAEGEQEATILNAQAEKKRAFLVAESREREGKAEANAIESVSQAITKGKENATQYFLSQKYIESLRDIASANNSKTVFMPLEMSKIVSNLGSLAELGKEVLLPKKP